MEDAAGIELTATGGIHVERRHSGEQSRTSEVEYTPQHYHRLARIMSKENNLAIFRRFDEINLLQLMALQAEIVELQGRFEAACQTDDAANRTYSKSFHELRRSQQRNEQTEHDRETSSNLHSAETINDGSIGDCADASPHLQADLLEDLGERLGRYSMWSLDVSVRFG